MRDAELARGEVLVDAVDLLEGERAALALLGELLHLRPARAHERELGRHEEPVQEHEEDDREEQ